MLQKCSPSPSGWLPKNAPKMVPKSSLDALLMLFMLKNNKGAAFGRRPPSGSPIFFNMKMSKERPETIWEPIWEHAWTMFGTFLGSQPEGLGEHFWSIFVDFPSPHSLAGSGHHNPGPCPRARPPGPSGVWPLPPLKSSIGLMNENP